MILGGQEVTIEVSEEFYGRDGPRINYVYIPEVSWCTALTVLLLNISSFDVL